MEKTEVLTTRRRNRDPNASLRAYEPTGKKVTIEMEFSFPVKNVLRYSGNSEHVEKITTDKNKVKDIFEPYEIVRYKLEL